MNPRIKGILTGSLLGLVLVGLATWMVSNWLRGGDVAEVAERLPEDTVLLISIRGFADLYLEFEDEIEAASGSRDAEEGIEKFEELFHVNPANRDSLEETGFSFTSPWGLAVLGDPGRRNLDLVYLIPVHDEDQVIDYLDDLIDSFGLNFEEEEIDEHDAFVVDEQVAWLVDEDYLIACLPLSRTNGMARDDRPDEALDCLEDLMDLDSDESLAETDSFQRAMSVADPDWNVLSYSPTDWISEALEDEQGIPESVSDLIEDIAERWAASLGTLTIERSQIRAQSINLIDSDYAHRFPMDGTDSLAEVIPGEPIAVARTSLQLHAAWTVLVNSDLMKEDREDVLDKLEDELGLDIEEDLMANLSGHVSLVVLEAEKRGGVPVDVVVYAPIEDEELALHTLEDLVDAIEDDGTDLDEESAGDGTYFITEEGTEFCIGLAHEHLVFAAGDGRCEVTFEGIEDGGETYLVELPSSVEAGMTSGPSTYAYLAVDQLVSLIRDEEDLNSDEDKALDVVEELIESAEFRGWSDESYATTEFILRPPEDDFGPGLEALAELMVEQIWENR